MPFGVSIYFDLNILEIVEGWRFNSSASSLLERGFIFKGFFPKNDICFLQISSPTLKIVSFLFFTEDISHFAS